MRRTVLFVHRWLGVALSLFFLLWFLSGIGMMYCEFPGVTPADRLQRSPVLEASAVRLNPRDALATLHVGVQPNSVVLGSFAGRPAYRFGFSDREQLVYADTGEVRGGLSTATLRTIAANWTGLPAGSANLTPDVPVDQWTVESTLRSRGPLWKFSWPDGQQVYVARESGDVVQYTTGRSRVAAYLGPIPHWLYFTPLRRHSRVWRAVVILTSALATTAACLGLALGVWTCSPSRRYRVAGRRTAVPYHGAKRWHVCLGMLFGAAAATWSFSGMLSLDPFPSAREREKAAQRRETTVAAALRRPVAINAFSARWPAAILAELPAMRIVELELVSAAGTSVYVATRADGSTRVVSLNAAATATFDPSRLASVLRAAAANTVTVRQLDHYDAYYRDRRGARPLPVLVVEDRDDGTRHYVDPATARVVGSYSDRDWRTRWLYHGLHSLDFPWLAHRPLWDIVVVLFMVGGAALSATGVTLALRVVAGRLSDLAIVSDRRRAETDRSRRAARRLDRG